jgi:hypothetical protein
MTLRMISAALALCVVVWGCSWREPRFKAGDCIAMEVVHLNDKIYCGVVAWFVNAVGREGYIVSSFANRHQEDATVSFGAAWLFDRCSCPTPQPQEDTR